MVRGEDVRSYIPEVTPAHLDMGGINELVLIRLWSLLLNFPRQVVYGQSTEFEKLMTRYLLCRNALEIPTILYPNQGILLPSYCERIDALDKVLRMPKVKPYFGYDFEEFMWLALKAKLQPDTLWQKKISTLYQQTIDGYYSLLSFLAKETISADMPEWDEIVLRSHMRLRDRRLLRRNAHEILEAMAIGKRHNWTAAVRWAVSRRRPLAICCLLYAHQALLSHLNKDAITAEANLVKAETFVRAVWPEACLSQPDRPFSDRWLALREQFIPFMTNFYRYNQGKGPYFERIHAWTDRK